MGFEPKWNAIFLCAILLFVVAFVIAAVIDAINRVGASAKKSAANDGSVQERQNSLYDLSSQLANVSGYINNGRIEEAYRLFSKISTHLDSYKHEEFPSIEWKSYFSSVIKSRDEFRAFFATNLPPPPPLPKRESAPV